MKNNNTTKTNTTNKAQTQVKDFTTETAKNLYDMRVFARKTLETKTHKEFYKLSENLLTMFYTLYTKQQNGENITELRESNIKDFRNILQGFGKIKGKYISAFETITDNNKQSAFFDSLMHHSYKYEYVTTNKDLAKMLCDKQVLSKKANELLEKDNAKGYKDTMKQVKALNEKIKEFRNTIANSEKRLETIQSKSAFAKFFMLKLQDIICNKMAKSIDEIEKEKAEKNAQRKAQRKAKKVKTKKATKPNKATETKQDNATESKKVA